MSKSWWRFQTSHLLTNLKRIKEELEQKGVHEGKNMQSGKIITYILTHIYIFEIKVPSTEEISLLTPVCKTIYTVPDTMKFFVINLFTTPTFWEQGQSSRVCF